MPVCFKREPEPPWSLFVHASVLKRLRPELAIRETPVILGLSRWRQGDSKMKANLGYRVRTCFENEKLEPG